MPRRFGLALLLLTTGCGIVPVDNGGMDAAVTPTAHFGSLYTSYLSGCAACHAPMAPGRTSDTEQSLDFSTKATAYTTLLAKAGATGLTGNEAGCNGVAFVVAGKSGDSLVLAAVDQTTRKAFSAGTAGACNDTAVADMTVKVGAAPPTGFVAALAAWIDAGAAND